MRIPALALLLVVALAGSTACGTGGGSGGGAAAPFAANAGTWVGVAHRTTPSAFNVIVFSLSENGVISGITLDNVPFGPTATLTLNNAAFRVYTLAFSDGSVGFFQFAADGLHATFAQQGNLVASLQRADRPFLTTFSNSDVRPSAWTGSASLLNPGTFAPDVLAGVTATIDGAGIFNYTDTLGNQTFTTPIVGTPIGLLAAGAPVFFGTFTNNNLPPDTGNIVLLMSYDKQFVTEVNNWGPAFPFDFVVASWSRN